MIKDKIPASAVALIRSKKQNSYLVLQRAFNAKDPWSGHLALPGGRRDKEDLDILQTAIRETREECGLILSEEHLVKALPLEHAGVRRGITTAVQPFLFEIEQEETLTLQEEEIRRYFWVDENHLLNSELHKKDALSKDYPELQFPYIEIEDAILWGFTYKVMGHTIGFYK